MWALRLLGPIIFIIFGIDQLRDTKEWHEYIPKWMMPLLPGGPDGFMKVHAVINILLGIWILSGIALKVSIGFAVIWMATIVASGFLSGKWRVGLRDLSITLGLLGYFLLLP
jgi:hypothetical protein